MKNAAGNCPGETDSQQRKRLEHSDRGRGLSRAGGRTWCRNSTAEIMCFCLWHVDTGVSPKSSRFFLKCLYSFVPPPPPPLLHPSCVRGLEHTHSLTVTFSCWILTWARRDIFQTFYWGGGGGLAGKSFGKCQAQLTLTFAFSHTAPLENSRKTWAQCV